MKAKIGNIEIEGTLEEIKEFIVNTRQPKDKENLEGDDQQSPDRKLANNPADSIQSKHKAEIDKDYMYAVMEKEKEANCYCSDFNPKCDWCVKAQSNASKEDGGVRQ